MAQPVVACMKRKPNHLIGNIVRNASGNAGMPPNMLGANPVGALRPRHAKRVVALFINH